MRSSARLFLCLLLGGTLFLGRGIARAEEPAPNAEKPAAESAPAGKAVKKEKNEEDLASLSEWQSYVGGWRGAGQLQRGSSQGAWSETADWAWKFTPGNTAIEFTTPDAKYIAGGELTAGKESGVYELSVQLVGQEQPVRFRGSKQAAGYVFDRADDRAGGEISRITFRQIADGKRLLALYEKRLGSGSRYQRVAEVGYTRQGIQFASTNTGRECVVTGGAGIIAVMYQGQTYYVCCTGCKDLFEEDPAGILAEYKAKKAKKTAMP